MKNLLPFAAICLSLVACSEKPQERPAVPGVVRATSSRPDVIPSTLSKSEGCAFDAVNDRPAKDAPAVDKAQVKLDGWAGNLTSGTSSQQTFVELDGPRKFYFKATPGVKRPDVAAFYNKPGLGEAGWTAKVDLPDASAGAYKVRIIQVEGQSGLACDSQKSVSLK
jgi:hypothetical protein